MTHVWVCVLLRLSGHGCSGGTVHLHGGASSAQLRRFLHGRAQWSDQCGLWQRGHRLQGRRLHHGKPTLVSISRKCLNSTCGTEANSHVYFLCLFHICSWWNRRLWHVSNHRALFLNGCSARAKYEAFHQVITAAFRCRYSTAGWWRERSSPARRITRCLCTSAMWITVTPALWGELCAPRRTWPWFSSASTRLAAASPSRSGSTSTLSVSSLVRTQ